MEEKGTILKGLVLDNAILDDHKIGSFCTLYHCIHVDNHGVASFDNLRVSLMNCLLSFENLM